MRQPLVRGNDWRSLSVAALGGWTPTKTVSVVMPAWNPTKLAPVLAALAGQTYPSELVEVLVVDDGNPAPVELPELRPERTRVVRVEEGWGRANAIQTGVEASDGEIIVWLDDDMLVFGHHLEAHARWHHVIDHAVVLGTKRFVDPEVPLTPAEVRDRVVDGSIATLHDWETSVPHGWVEELWAETDDLTTGGWGSFRSVVGATVSMSRAMAEAAGGLQRRLRLGEDTEFGFRLAQAGAVLLPDHEARAWHLGFTHAMEHSALVNRYNHADFADHVPSLRSRRNRYGRSYRVPYVEVVVRADGDAEGQLESVTQCVDALLDSDMLDLRVLLVGRWSSLDDRRVSPLHDPARELGVTHRWFREEPRVDLVEPDDPRLAAPARAVYRLTLHASDLAPAVPAVRAWAYDMERTRLGLRRFLSADGREVARMERVAAYGRAAWHGARGAEADALVAEAFGAHDVAALEAGWQPLEEREVPRFRNQDLRQMDRAESWARAQREIAAGRAKVQRGPLRPATPRPQGTAEAATQGVRASSSPRTRLGLGLGRRSRGDG
ncbi:glycosyltransferase family 2 protein [Nocardioides sp. Y6]|uniref:Glycosyltransferase family 2 protein n=1 Tax=Nocardioides malaquae TaxID=2773426 RepID=A0ABR9RSQ9_9ACTN|nr:glycosyltransferase family 2 protein [Nocardioides malaquae]MBE7324613.1 glycosyltransferase family 2 protein [Nocardioides malaquae]